MSLLGTLIDSRTLAVIAAAGSFTFAHGLPASPDEVVVYENTTTDSTGSCKIAVKYDATNVSLYNHGAVGSATLRSVAKVYHSVVR
jgi:hypothetical protein